MAKPVILCVDDEKIVLDSLKEQLRRNADGRFVVETAQSAAEALERFDELAAAKTDVPVVIADHIMPGIKGTDLLVQVHERAPKTLKVLLTGQADADAVGRAVNAANLYRYIAKPWQESDLAMTLREALRRFFNERELDEKNRELFRVNAELETALASVERYRAQLEAENVYLQDEIKLEHNFDEIVGESASLKRVLRRIEQVAASDATVLILGESGTGKELLARAVHDHSKRRTRPLVKVNCAALPSNLIESELFGHEKGAFTGAVGRRPGRFELADGGTLFLDEIGELPIGLQPKLLRALQEGEIERVGDSRTRTVDVRLIAATNQDLERAVAENRFREDLFYRLDVFPLESPPLRERRDDIPLLAQFFARKYAKKMGKSLRSIPKRVVAQLETYDWPGNVRELENIIERAVILAAGDRLELDDSFGRRTGPSRRNETHDAPRTHREMEIRLIRDALEACDWVVGGKSGAARRLDMAASTLRERIRKYGIERHR